MRRSRLKKKVQEIFIETPSKKFAKDMAQLMNIPSNVMLPLTGKQMVAITKMAEALADMMASDMVAHCKATELQGVPPPGNLHRQVQEWVNAHREASRYR